MHDPKYDPARWAAAAERAQANQAHIAAGLVKATLPIRNADSLPPMGDDDGGIEFDLSGDYGGEA